MSVQRPVVMVPYRDVDNHEIRYAPAPGRVDISNPYDSDVEPLISGPEPTELDEDSLMRFTATGRPMPAFQHQGLQNFGGSDMYTMPQLLPKRYTDDSIIPAIVTDVIPAGTKEGDGNKKEKQEKGKRRSSFMSRLKGRISEDKDGKLMKVVYMPRRDYLKFFARGLKGEYIGTEPWRRWSEEELEQKFGQHKPASAKKGYRAPC